METQLQILRVFGPSAAEVSAVLRGARDDGCPGLRLLERDGEFAICVQVSAPNRAMAEQYCEKWIARLEKQFGDDIYAGGEVSLAQTTLDLLLDKRRLIVAVDETSGRLLGGRLQPLPHSEAVFDFGTESYADAGIARQIAAPSALEKRFPGDVVQLVAGRALAALAAAGADYAVAYMPATVGQCPFVLVADKRGVAACAINPELTDAAIGNQMLDLLRRRLLGLRLTASSIAFKPGQDRPLLIVSEQGRSRGNTTRFSLRRRAATQDSDRVDFEPMLDFTAAGVGGSAAATGRGAYPQTNQPSAPRQPVDYPTGTISFEEDGAQDNEDVQGLHDYQDEEAIVYAPRQTDLDPVAEIPARRAAAPTDRGLPDPLDIRTAGPAAAGAARRGRTLHTGHSNYAPMGEDGRTQGAAPSLLDQEIPDFSAELDPAAVSAARAADEAAARRRGVTPDAEPDMDEYDVAASRLFSLDDEAAEAADTPRPARRKTGKPAGYGVAGNRSLAIIEKSERRRRRTIITTLVLFFIALVVGGVALWWFLSRDLGAVPNPKNYGTAAFDSTAAAYMDNAVQKREGVVGYLGLPGLTGELVYAADAQPQVNEKTGETTEILRFATPNALDSAAPGNTVLENTGDGFKDFANLDVIQQNSGFTLYMPGKSYAFKVVAVYYYDPAEQGEGAFDLYGATDLSSYYDYLGFVAGITARSLFDTDVDLEDGSHFLTLTTETAEEDVRLCITGRMIEEGELATLVPSAIKISDTPLLTASQYQNKGQPMPAVTELLSASVDRYAQQSAARTAKNNNAQGESGTDLSSLSDDVAAMVDQTQKLMASADQLMAGLTDIAGGSNAVEADIKQAGEGGLPEQSVTVEQLAAATATPTPTESPTQAPTPAPESDAAGGEVTAPPAPETTEEPTPEPPAEEEPVPDNPPSAEGETINVTMNGSAQTMDLVECLAMVAQNELGPNAPAEAYKAQCVATHCWILSQGGYPSVLGQTPGAAARAAAEEVARVLITYNGQVCFTPYFASASTGTASAADVWGGDRAWLQAVDSPYDQQIATNWATNGNTSGSARFSRQTLQDRILEKMDVDLSGIDPNEWFTILSANEYGWVAQMRVGPEETCSGRWFRENLLARQSVDGRSLRSQCFTFYYDGDLDCFIFDVKGYGHGCGMSQWGAIGYARNGWSYQDILTHYFVGTTITTY